MNGGRVDVDAGETIGGYPTPPGEPFNTVRSNGAPPDGLSLQHPKGLKEENPGAAGWIEDGDGLKGLGRRRAGKERPKRRLDD